MINENTCAFRLLEKKNYYYIVRLSATVTDGTRLGFTLVAAARQFIVLYTHVSPGRRTGRRAADR